MDWTAPYLLAAFAYFAAVEIWYIVMLTVTGRRYRRVASGFSPSGPDCEPSDLSFEELGLLAQGKRRLTEVALLRLCLEGHVRQDDLTALVDDPGEAAPAAGERRSVREAILDRLRRRSPDHLEDVLEEGQRRGDCSEARRKLIELKLLDEQAERLDRTRGRVFNAYMVMAIVAIIGTLVCMGVAMTAEPDTDRIKVQVAFASVGLLLVWAAVTFLTPDLTGGALDPNTPAGRGLLRRAEGEPPGPADDRLLHRVALKGLKTVPEFASATERPASGAL